MRSRAVSFCSASILFLFAVVARAADASDLPKFQFRGIILKASSLKYRPHDDIIFPTVLAIHQHVAKPIAKYYMYYAPHDAPGGICLAVADHPEGPWREYANNPVISHDWAPYYKVSHVSGPDAIWSDEQRKVFLYFHGENNVTRLATSEDGIHFRYEGSVIDTKMIEPGVTEASYGRVSRDQLPGKNNRYVMLVMGNHKNTRNIYLAWSKDGRHWQAQPDPIIRPPAGTDQVAGAICLPWKGKHYVIFHGHDSAVKANDGFDLFAAETSPTFDLIGTPFKYIDRTFVSPTNVAVMSPSILNESGKLYLYFNVGPRLNNQIALAVADR